MRAGRLRHRVTRQARTVLRTRGVVTETWAADEVVWASVEPLAGRELERARAVVANATHKITMRYLSTITVRDLLTFDGRTFHIEAIQDVDERNIELVLTCVEQI